MATSDRTTAPPDDAVPQFLTEHHPDDGTSERPPEINAAVAAIARGLLRLLGWRLTGKLENVPKFVLIVAPHTAYYDGLIMLLTIWSYRVKPDWMVKAELVSGPFGWLLRRLGAVPIDRRHSQDTVTQAVATIRERERVMLTVAPEGTRRKTDHWKTGFYWIAVEAEVPIGLGVVDYKHKRVGIRGMLHPTGDIDADMVRLRALYDPLTALHPDKYSDRRIRPSGRRGR